MRTLYCVFSVSEYSCNDSSMVGTELTVFAGKFHFLAEEYINANDVIAFCGYLMNKMRRNFIKISGVDVGSMWGR